MCLVLDVVASFVWCMTDTMFLMLVCVDCHVVVDAGSSPAATIALAKCGALPPAMSCCLSRATRTWCMPLHSIIRLGMFVGACRSAVGGLAWLDLIRMLCWCSDKIVTGSFDKTAKAGCFVPPASLPPRCSHSCVLRVFLLAHSCGTQRPGSFITHTAAMPRKSCAFPLIHVARSLPRVPWTTRRSCGTWRQGRSGAHSWATPRKSLA